MAALEGFCRMKKSADFITSLEPFSVPSRGNVPNHPIISRKVFNPSLQKNGGMVSLVQYTGSEH